jgi:hypothetical protein
MAFVRRLADDGVVRLLVGVLVIALVALTLPGGACCVPVPTASHDCCRTHCLKPAPSTAVVKPTIALALSIAPLTMRVISVVTHQRFCEVVSTRSFDPLVPLPLRI